MGSARESRTSPAASRSDPLPGVLARLLRPRGRARRRALVVRGAVVGRARQLSARSVAVWSARLSAVPAPAAERAPTPFRLAANGAAGHVEAVADCRRRIAAGELYQANLCVRLEARFDGDPLDLFARALPLAQPRFGALVGGIVSLSPERFLRREGRAGVDRADQGNAPADRSGEAERGRARGAARVEEGRGRARDDRRPDAQRPRAGLHVRNRARAGAARRAHAGVWHWSRPSPGGCATGSATASCCARASRPAR